MRYVNVSGDERFVTYGFPGIRRVEAGGVLEVPDELAAAYDQPGIWEPETPSSSATAVAAPPAVAAAGAEPKKAQADLTAAQQQPTSTKE